ncbi:MAG TPA: alpha/beta hydrolase, partial [Gammaproteobacteria bacterium]|nr:alpha/beta hydrolase [Gammaproteobacteria bacterium]
TDLGKADPRLRRFAEALVAAQFQVLVPELTSLTRFRVEAANIDAVADAVAYLQTLPQPPGGRLGLVAISYAGGPAVLAAVGEASPAVDFVFCVGTYYDLTEAITFATTGWYRDHGELRYRPPLEAGRWLLLFGQSEQLAGPDGELLREIARRRLQDPQADVTALTTSLGEAGRAASALANNRDPARVPALIAALPESLQREFRTLDLAEQDLSGLKAELILLHGRDDPMIPAEQSEALASAVPNARVRLFLVNGLMHVDVQPGWRDALALWQVAVALLEARDGVNR